MKSRIGIILGCLIMAGFIEKDMGARENRESLREKTTTVACPLPGYLGLYGKAEPWTAKQLMSPAGLAAIIEDPKAKKPVIVCVGPGAIIKGSKDTGPAKEKENLEKLKKLLDQLPTDTDIVIYCGCCPFDHCPNVRPAFSLLNEMKFNNAHLLNLEHNIKTDWVSRGYPQEKN